MSTSSLSTKIRYNSAKKLVDDIQRSSITVLDYPNWVPNKVYEIGNIVNYDNEFYIAAFNHVSTNVDEDETTGFLDDLIVGRWELYDRTSYNNYYVFIGRPQPWDNDLEPDAANNSLKTEYSAWHDMTAMKRVIGRDATLGFRRIDWVSGTVYAEYDDLVDLTTLDYYVFTNDSRVYKCISNDNDSPSTIKPTHTTTDLTKQADGYVWKYMFLLSESVLRKFAVGNFLPVTFDPTVVNQAEVGAINHLKIESVGTGYTVNASVTAGTQIPIYVDGDGDENGTATCTIVTDNGVVQSVSAITSGGDEYPYAPEVNIPVMIRQIGTAGAIETAFALASTNPDGEIISVQVVLGGSGYVNGTARIVQSTCQGYAETNSLGEIINVEIGTSRSGIGFRKAKATVVGTFIEQSNIRPIISPFRGHGASPDRELLARFVLINLNFAYDEGDGDFTIENDFRRIGLIQNPYNYNTNVVATARTLNAKKTLVLDSITGSFNEDDIIYGQVSGAKGLNVDLINGNRLRYIKDEESTNNIDFIVEGIQSVSGATAAIVSVEPPEVEPYSGDILFINNRTPIDRTSEQIETITLVFEY